jgi:hypothetical protein
VPGGLQNPHDIAVSADGGTVYAVELQPFVVWKLTNGGPTKQPQPQGILHQLLGFLGWSGASLFSVPDNEL